MASFINPTDQDYSCACVSGSLLACYQLDADTDSLAGPTRVADISGNHGYYAGEPSDRIATNRFGQPSSGIDFDGNDDYIWASGITDNYPSRSGLFQNVNDPFSISSWIQPVRCERHFNTIAEFGDYTTGVGSRIDDYGFTVTGDSGIRYPGWDTLNGDFTLGEGTFNQNPYWLNTTSDPSENYLVYLKTDTKCSYHQQATDPHIPRWNVTKYPKHAASGVSPGWRQWFTDQDPNGYGPLALNGLRGIILGNGRYNYETSHTGVQGTGYDGFVDCRGVDITGGSHNFPLPPPNFPWEAEPHANPNPYSSNYKKLSAWQGENYSPGQIGADGPIGVIVDPTKHKGLRRRGVGLDEEGRPYIVYGNNEYRVAENNILTHATGWVAAHPHRPIETPWYHIIGTFDGTTPRIYLNGEEVALGSERLLPHSLDPGAGFEHRRLRIGDSIDGGNNFFNGKIDEVRIYSEALSVENTALLYHDCPTPTQTPTHTQTPRHTQTQTETQTQQ